MTHTEFCYWLQGHFELNGEILSPEQVRVVREHLDLTFNKVTKFKLNSNIELKAPEQPFLLSNFGHNASC